MTKEKVSFCTQLFDNLKDEVYVFNADTLKFIQVNNAGHQKLGYTNKELQKMTLFEIQLEFTIDSFKKLTEPLLKDKKKKIRYETVHKRKDCSLYIVEVHLQLNYFDNKAMFIGIIIDISERKKDEVMFLKQQSFVQTVMNAVTHPFYVIDINTREIILWNKATLKFDMKKGLKCYNITHNRKFPCDGLAHPCPINEILNTKKPVRVEHQHFDSYGKREIHEVNGFPVFDKNGKIIQIIEYCLDVTDRKTAEEKLLKQQEQLLRADKLISLGILIAGVAHEINNPNNAILLNSQFLTKVWQDIVPILDKVAIDDSSLKIGGIKYEKLRQKAPVLFSGISESSRRIKSIVEELKNYSRKDTNKEHIFININSVIKSSVNLMNRFVKNHSINFDLQLEKNLPEIKANFQKIEQVIINLVHNSCQAVKTESGLITIFTETGVKKNYILIKIKDNGIGIHQKDMKLITEPFFTTKREAGGLGLGLSISDKIINDHNGKLLFESKPSEGTIVKIYLPLPGMEIEI